MFLQKAFVRQNNEKGKRQLATICVRYDEFLHIHSCHIASMKGEKWIVMYYYVVWNCLLLFVFKRTTIDAIQWIIRAISRKCLARFPSNKTQQPMENVYKLCNTQMDFAVVKNIFLCVFIHAETNRRHTVVNASDVQQNENV